MLKTVRARLFVSYLVIIAFTLGAVGLLLTTVLLPGVQARLIHSNLQLAFPPTALQLRAEALRILRDAGREQLVPGLRQAVAEIGGQRGIRLLILSSGYRVLVDSRGALEGQSFAAVRPPLDRQPEALAQGRYTLPDGQELLWVGGPFDAAAGQESAVAQRLPFILVLAQARRDNPTLSRQLRNQFIVAGAGGLLLALLLAFLVARSIARPLQRVAVAAEEVARGNYDLQLDIPAPDEVARVARSFNTMTRAVRASQQAQRDFVANVSHELKTPLTSIQGFSQAILDGTAGDPPAIRRAGGVIHDEAGRMARLVSQLLDLAKIEAGQIVMARQPLTLSAVLADCLEKLAPQADRAGVSLTADLSQLPAGLRLLGDGDRLTQVFIILLDNALQHTPAGGQVTVEAQPGGEAQVSVSVADTGPGIPPEDLPRIFERFYQVDKSRARKSDGSGLGLAIAREIVAAHGGRIVAESIVGVGSKFTVHLPL